MSTRNDFKVAYRTVRLVARKTRLGSLSELKLIKSMKAEVIVSALICYDAHEIEFLGWPENWRKYRFFNERRVGLGYISDIPF
jgi:hypothetical protein